MRLLESRSAWFLAALMVMFMVVPMVSAADFTFKYNTTIDFKGACTNSSGDYCNPTTQCNFTLIAPDGTALVNNKPSTNQVAFHNYSIPASSLVQFGEYQCNFQCSDLSGSFKAFSENKCTVTRNGLDKPGNSLLIFIYALAIFIVIGLTFAIMWNLAAMFTATSTINVVATSWGFYFAWTILYFLSSEYVPNNFINGILTTLYNPITLILIWLPLIGLFVTIFYNVLIKKQHNGVKI